MTAFFRGKDITQADKLLIDGKEYTEEEIKQMIKDSK